MDHSVVSISLPVSVVLNDLVKTFGKSQNLMNPNSASAISFKAFQAPEKRSYECIYS
jgi:hypothetical protein